MIDPGTWRSAVGAAASVVLLALAASCGDDGGTSDLSPAGERGRTVANSNGCAACHGANGQGGAGPPFIELAGSTRELIDGSTVVADDAYLRRAIATPEVEIVAGYNIQMPRNGLSESEIDDVVAYIKELSPGAAGD